MPDAEDAELLANGYKLVFRPLRADCFDEYLGTALRYYGNTPFGAVVLFLPDRNHRFPWQPGYDGPPTHEALRIV